MKCFVKLEGSVWFGAFEDLLGEKSCKKIRRGNAREGKEELLKGK